MQQNELAISELANMVAANVCVDCQSKEGNLNIRTRQLCQECLLKYVGAKISKRMDSYRPKYLSGDEKPKLLLPLSGGVSSLVLLRALNAQYEHVATKQGRSAYNLLLFHVRLPGDSATDDDLNWWMRVRDRFPLHTTMEPVGLSAVLSVDASLKTDLQHLGLSFDTDMSDDACLSQVLAKARTPTAIADLREILLQRLIVAIADKEGCDSILWGHSSSRLAAKALAGVAKGRGAAVPNDLCEGPSLLGKTFHHPVRDLYKSELELYLDSVPEDLSVCLCTVEEKGGARVSIKQTSIDELLNGYVMSQGQKYPGIMANVVRTTGKLQQLPANATACAVCKMPTTDSTTTKILCYGCERMKEDIAVG